MSIDDKTKAKPAPATSKRKFWTLLFMAVFVGLVGYAVHSALDQSETGSIDTASLQQQRSAVTFDTKPVSVQTNYGSFQYPAALKPIETADDKPPVLVSRSYTYGDIETWRLGVSVLQLNGQSVSSDASYQLRASQSSQYQQSSVTYGANTFTIMTDTQAAGFNQVAYLVKGSQAVEISLYGDDAVGDGPLRTTFATVLRSWEWPQ